MKIKKVHSNPKQHNSKQIKQVLNTVYDSWIIPHEERHIHKITNAVLLSPTRFLRTWTELSLFKIPNQVLEPLRVVGEQLMLCLEEMHSNKITDLSEINYLSIEVENMFRALVQFLIDNKMKIKAVEKHVTNGYWHCYVDLIVSIPKDTIYVCEIKTRSNHDIRVSDKLQLAMNMLIMGDRVKYGYVIIINRKDYTVSKHRVRIIEMQKLLSAINMWFVEMKLNGYMLGGRTYSHNLRHNPPARKR